MYVSIGLEPQWAVRNAATPNADNTSISTSISFSSFVPQKYLRCPVNYPFILNNSFIKGSPSFSDINDHQIKSPFDILKQIYLS